MEGPEYPAAAVLPAGEMPALIHRLDWAATPVGARADWPADLHATVAHMLASPRPMFLWWGEALVQFYNDAFRELLSPGLHPWLLGGSGRDDYRALWPQLAPTIEAVLHGGRTICQEDVRLPVCRFGQEEEGWWTIRYAPVVDRASPGGVAGVLVTYTDVTDRQLDEAARRRDLAHRRFLDAMDQQFEGHGAVLRDRWSRMLAEHLGADGVGFDQPGAIPAVDGVALRAGRTVHRGDVRGDILLSDSERDELRADGLRAMIAVPILRDGCLVATFLVRWSKARPIQSAEIALVETVARRAWAAMNQALA